MSQSRVSLFSWFISLFGATAFATGKEAVSPEGAAAPIRMMWDAPRPLDAAFDTRTPARGCARFQTANSPPDGDYPQDLTFTPDGQTAVIVNTATDNITFFSLATLSITHTVPVGDFPTHVAVTLNGQYAVVANVFGNSVSVVDVGTHSVVATVPVTGVQPFRVAITPDSHYAIVAVINDAVISAFSVIDLLTRTEVRSFPSASQGSIGFFFSPESGSFGNIFTQFALSPDGTVIVLPDRGGSRVVLYDPATGGVLGNLPTAGLPTGVDISPDNTTAVVSHEGSNNRITKIDLPSRSITGTFTTAASLEDQVVRITQNKSHALAAISNNTIFVNLATGATTATLFTGVVGDIRLSYNGQYAFVTNFNAAVIDVATQTLVRQMPFAACVPAAVSPVAMRAVALNNRFREDIQVYDINGAAGNFLGFASTGALPEGDATRDLAISPDGQTLVACNNVSRNVTIFNVATHTARAYIDVGERPLAAAITPDGHYAVVCATDANLVQIIDLTTDSIVRTLSVSTRPARVRISPDGQFAYVLSVAGTDLIHFIRLNGAASMVLSTALAGQTGSWQGVAYSTTSGIELTADGTILGVCDSFNNRLKLYDTATRMMVGDVPVGSFPITVGFLPNGTRAYVANAFDDTLTVVDVPARAAITTLTGLGDRPFTVNVDAAGQFVYVGNYEPNIAAVKVISAASNTIVRSVLIGPRAARAAILRAADNVLYVAAAGSGTSSGPPAVLRINAAGAASAVIDATVVSADPSDMVFSAAHRTAIVAEPPQHGLDFVTFAQPGDTNDDGVIDAGDIQVFVNALITQAAGPIATCAADVNADNVVNLADVGLFVSMLLAG